MSDAPPRTGFWGGLLGLLPRLVPLVGVLILLVILVDELQRDGVEVQPIAVPPRLVELGLTPDVVALRLTDALAKLQDSVGGEPRRRTGADVGGAHPDFTVPLTGLSLRSVASTLRGMLGIPERRVSGEVTVDGEVLRLRLRLSGQGVIADVAAANPDALIRAGAPQVWRVVQPVLYAWWLSSEAATEAEVRETLEEMMQEAGSDRELMRTLQLLLGRSYARTGEAQAALAVNEAQLREFPNYPPAIYARGRALRELGRLDEAMAAFDAAQRAMPGVAFPRVGRAQVLRDRGENQAAADLLQAVVRDNQVDAQGKVELGAALLALGRAREALPLARRAVAEDAKNASAHTLLGDVLLAGGQPAAALAAYEAALAQAPLWGEAQLGRVEALRALGRAEEARAALAEARPVIAAVPRLAPRLARLDPG
ncbi:tetratricopeptide repeat protein [Sediminicoccus rosea]|uniref:Tetratricopeptide repeat protein n=1 Tax=Sediminicoccus rosea TaxID=1225128 RepID=A0ABZ0PCW3_9PROT|nr:tetratricopeptide repeat protein [Sediminicoccus rosea]WPB83533.1 tetratricopeptide repeat protein [Sediminicoccus rosea]